MKTSQNKIDKVLELHTKGMSTRKIGKALGGLPKSTVNDIIQRWKKGEEAHSGGTFSLRKNLPVITTIDIETAPVKGAVWGLWNNNLGLNQIDTDWFILSAAAKQLGNSEVEYLDLRGTVDQQDDTDILDMMWMVLDRSDIIISQNGKKFDVKKLNARFILNGYQPPSSFKHIDTLEIAKRTFAFTSNKLEYMTEQLCENKKLKHTNYPGMLLWTGMLEDDIGAWEECEEYNIMDVISTEELYLKMAAWDTKHPNLNLYSDEEEVVCRCGSTNIKKAGYAYTNVSKFQRYRCSDCGAESRGRKNLLSKEKVKSLHMNIT